MPKPENNQDNIIKSLWSHWWGKCILITVAIAIFSWAIRETAVITLPIFSALKVVLLPLAIAFTIAYILTPIIDFLCKWRISRTIASAITFILISIILTLSAIIIVPVVVNQGSELFTKFVDSFYYEDINGNGSFDKNEQKAKAQYLLSNKNCVIREDKGVIQKTTTWIEQLPVKSKIYLDEKPSKNAMFFLLHYIEKTKNYTSPKDNIIYDPNSALHNRHNDLMKLWFSEKSFSRKTEITQEEEGEVLSFVNKIKDSNIRIYNEMLLDIYAENTKTESSLSASIEIITTSLNKEFKTAITPEKTGEWVKSLFANISRFLEIGLSIFLIPIYAFFLTIGMPNMKEVIKKYTPTKNRDQTIGIIGDIEKVISAFFRGRLIVCIICSILTSIGFLIIGVPNAILFGIAIGLATAIPLAGLIFMIPAVLIVLSDGGNDIGLKITLMVIYYGIIQTLEATVLTPTIMGKEVELHPIVLILSLLLCGYLLGFLGLLLAVPIAATIRILLRAYVLPRIKEVAAVDGTKFFTKKKKNENINN